MEPQDPKEPLEYWHTDQRPADSVALILSVLGGIILGVILVFFAGFFILAVTPMTGEFHMKKSAGYLLAAGWIGVMSIALVTLILRIRAGKHLAIESRSKPRRFFVLGLLIGCGIGALIEGICVGQMGAGQT